jgi:peptidoglycan-associated lipoprotein
VNLVGRPIIFIKELVMYKWTVIVALIGLLAACSSPIKLNDVSVEDKSGQASTAMKTLTPATTSAAGDKKSSVATLDTTAGAKSASGSVAGAGADALAAANARTIYFEFDSFAIRPEYQAIIETNARNLKANKNQRISIEGHTDERGGREYNLALGQKRADAVRKALSLLGVADAQMESVSFGKEKPAATGESEMAMEKNRRAEIVIR